MPDVLPPAHYLPPSGGVRLPAMIEAAGERASRRFIEFFTANIRNPNTRAAYARAVSLFAAWCDEHRLSLADLEPVAVSAYVEELMRTRSAPTVKQHLAAIRMLCDWLVIGQVIPMNPAASVRGPTHVVRKGKTLVLSAEQARTLLDSIDTSTLIGLRDRALIGTMVYSFARVSAVVNMNVADYWQNGKRWWLRLHEKGGKHHELSTAPAARSAPRGPTGCSRLFGRRSPRGGSGDSGPGGRSHRHGGTTGRPPFPPRGAAPRAFEQNGRSRQRQRGNRGVHQCPRTDAACPTNGPACTVVDQRRTNTARSDSEASVPATGESPAGVGQVKSLHPETIEILEIGREMLNAIKQFDDESHQKLVRKLEGMNLNSKKRSYCDAIKLLCKEYPESELSPPTSGSSATVDKGALLDVLAHTKALRIVMERLRGRNTRKRSTGNSPAPKISKINRFVCCYCGFVADTTLDRPSVDCDVCKMPFTNDDKPDDSQHILYKCVRNEHARWRFTEDYHYRGTRYGKRASGSCICKSELEPA